MKPSVESIKVLSWSTGANYPQCVYAYLLMTKWTKGPSLCLVYEHQHPQTYPLSHTQQRKLQYSLTCPVEANKAHKTMKKSCFRVSIQG